MHRVGIPASIKLAQAIVESGSGKSTLARQSNNHFGIKCGNKWSGGKVYKKDDDYVNGKLIRSCFRAFDDPFDSFIAHSQFLTNPKSKRYRFLFEINLYDYKAWAQGLKKSGYATDPNYPKKLISVIEQYQLYEYDYQAVEEMEEVYVVENTKEELIEKVIEPMIESSNEPARTSTDDYYVVKLGDNMASIAESHDMATTDLYYQNRMPFGSEPAVGERLFIRGYLQFKKRPKLSKHITSKRSDGDHFLFEEVILFSAE